MKVTLEGKTYNAKEFYDPCLSEALRAAQKYAGKTGFVAGMPHLIEWKAKDHNSPFWKNWYETSTEEHILPDSTGRFGKKRKQLVLVTQGHGILTPQRIKKACRKGMVSGAVKLTPDECSTLLQSPFAIPYEEYNCHPEPYTIVLTQEQTKAYKSGQLSQSELITHPRAITWAGGKQNLNNYFKKAKYNDKVGVWYDTANADTPRGRVLFLDYDDYGLYGSNSLYFNGRFVGVKAPKTPQRAKKKN